MTMSGEHTSSKPPQDGFVGPDQAVKRPLPPTRSVSDALKASLQGADKDFQAPQDPGEARDGLFQYLSDVLTRAAEIQKHIDTTMTSSELDAKTKAVISPFSSKAFLRFINETLAEVSMRYIATARFNKPGLPNDDPEHLEGATNGAPEQNVTIPAGVDPALASHPAVRLAISQGLDLASDAYDDD